MDARVELVFSFFAKHPLYSIWWRRRLARPGALEKCQREWTGALRCLTRRQVQETLRILPRHCTTGLPGTARFIHLTNTRYRHYLDCNQQITRPVHTASSRHHLSIIRGVLNGN